MSRLPHEAFLSDRRILTALGKASPDVSRSNAYGAGEGCCARLSGRAKPRARLVQDRNSLLKESNLVSLRTICAPIGLSDVRLAIVGHGI